MIKFGAILILAIQIAVFLLIGWAVYVTITDPQSVATAVGEFFGTLFAAARDSAN